MSLGEFDLIGQLFKPLASASPGALGLSDDAAVIKPEADTEIVIAKDAMIEGVHFLPDDPPETVSGKLLRINLSDLAAMGADPSGYLLVVARSPRIDDAYLRAFAKGLAQDQELFGISLLGGDTVRTPGPLSLSLTILGTVPEGRAIKRLGAMAGDQIWVSGTLGDAAIGLRLLNGLAAPEELAIPLVDRYRTPRPRITLGCSLRGVATSAIDISDGLLADLGHIVELNEVGADIHLGQLPLSEEAALIPGAKNSALTGGDDYEILFTAPPERRLAIEALGQETGTKLTVIGEVTEGSAITVRDAEGKIIQPGSPGWRHF